MLVVFPVSQEVTTKSLGIDVGREQAPRRSGNSLIMNLGWNMAVDLLRTKSEVSLKKIGWPTKKTLVMRSADENIRARSASKSVFDSLACASCLYLGKFSSADRLMPNACTVAILRLFQGFSVLPSERCANSTCE